jgi:hypothetical protein
MRIPDETLMAFADGELDASARAAIEIAMREDPEIEKRVAEHRALRQRIEKAYAGELSEPVPERWVTAANRAPGAAGKVVDLSSARDAKALAAATRPRKSWWQPAGAIAASLIIGFGLGYGGWHPSSSPLVRGAGGALVASGDLARALSHQLAAEQSPAAAVRIGVSFLAKSGDYCRTFALSGASSPSGLACRRGQEWQVQTFSQGAGVAEDNAAYRAAGSEMSPAVVTAVEELISGEALDPAAEAAARSKDWTAIR